MNDIRPFREAPVCLRRGTTRIATDPCPAGFRETMCNLTGSDSLLRYTYQRTPNWRLRTVVRTRWSDADGWVRERRSQRTMVKGWRTVSAATCAASSKLLTVIRRRTKSHVLVSPHSAPSCSFRSTCSTAARTSGSARRKSIDRSLPLRQSALATRSTNPIEKRRSGRPSSKCSYHRVETPASSATSACRKPGTRRKPAAGRPTSCGFSRLRASVKSARNATRRSAPFSARLIRTENS